MLKLLILVACFTMVTCSCPSGWSALPDPGGCYYVDLRLNNFYGAENLCQENDAHLITIRNAFQNEKIKEVLNASIEALWIGFNRLSGNGWEWIDGWDGNYKNKCPDFNTKNVTYRCAKFTESGCWMDANCSDLSYFVCGTSSSGQATTTSTVISATTTTTVIQSTTTTNADGCNSGFTLMEDGFCYYASENNMFFNDANSECRSRGAELVSIHNYWENVIAMKFALYAHEVLHRPTNNVIWIGFQCTNSSVSSCTWTDGSPFDYSAMYGDPNYNGGYYYGLMYILAQARGRWNTWENTANLSFICKHRSAVVVPETSDDQLPLCNIGFWPLEENNLCYGFDSTDQKQWVYCDAFCIQIGGHCASIRSQQANSDLFNLFQRTQPPMDISTGYHIGLKEKDSTWYWVDGSIYGYTNWAIASGYPRQGETPYVSPSTSGLWQTSDPKVYRSTACVQKPIKQSDVTVCPTQTYFGMGEIRSPGYPNNYVPGLTCTYTLYDMVMADPPIYWGAVMRTKLALYFTSFRTDIYDVVEVFDGADTNSPLITPSPLFGIAGNRQHFYSTGYNMTIRFTTRRGNGYKGWRAVFGPYTTKP